LVISRDEHPRADTRLEVLAQLGTPFRENGTITAGNASGINDGACALLLASEKAAAKHGLTPRARVVAMATAGVPPRIMGMGPAPATRKVLQIAGLTLDQMDVIERHRPGPSPGHERRPAGYHRPVPVAAHRRTLRPVHHVYRRRPGHRHGH
jgi:acetyl-CoA acetyltransferase